MAELIHKPWSYSSLGLFQQCPHKYYRLKVKKDIKEAESDQMRFGNEVHKSAELYFTEDKPIPEEHQFLERYVRPLAERPGKVYAEVKLGLTRQLKPCGFFDKDVWYRGIVDLLIIHNGTALMLDWKTGNPKYPDTKQLEMMAIAVFRKHPEVQRVVGGLIFVCHKQEVPYKINREDAKGKLRYWVEETTKLDRAHMENRWVKKPNFTCKGWCPVTDCPYWEPKRMKR